MQAVARGEGTPALKALKEMAVRAVSRELVAGPKSLIYRESTGKRAGLQYSEIAGVVGRPTFGTLRVPHDDPAARGLSETALLALISRSFVDPLFPF